MTDRICVVDGCNNPQARTGRTRCNYCLMHRSRRRRLGTTELPARPPRILTCTVEGCNNKHDAHGLCPKHYRRLRVYGSPLGGTGYVGQLGRCPACTHPDHEAIDAWLIEHGPAHTQAAQVFGIPKDSVKHHYHCHLNNLEYARKLASATLARLERLQHRAS